ncbi:MAG: branched-chain amino acid ABC transporter permease [Planctomycetota bacterium]|jgi:branched-chain amino acid transport system permease protein|nr:branched-chain amino acid ABC transporter permease [Planctomycetota bacterium]
MLKKTILAAVCATLFFLPRVLPNHYYVHMCVMIGINILLAVGLNLLTGYTGQINMGQYGLFAIGAYASAVLSRNLGVDVWLAMPLAVLTTAVFGFFVGFPSLRVEGPYLALVTMGFAESVRISFNNSVYLGEAMGVAGIPAPSWFGAQLYSAEKFFYIVYTLVLFGLLFNHNLIESALGRKFRAVRDDPLAANVVGVNVKWVKLTAFCLCAAYAGLAGSLYAHYTGYVNPSIFTQVIQTNFLLMIVLGGLGFKWGGVIGGVVVTIFFEMTRQFVQYQMVVFGLMMILIVLFFSRGVSGFVQNLAKLLRGPAPAEGDPDA